MVFIEGARPTGAQICQPSGERLMDAYERAARGGSSWREAPRGRNDPRRPRRSLLVGAVVRAIVSPPDCCAGSPDQLPLLLEDLEKLDPVIRDTRGTGALEHE